MENHVEDNKKGRMIAVPIPEKIGEDLQNHWHHIDGERVDPEDEHITIVLFEKGDYFKMIHKFRNMRGGNICYTW